MLLSGHPRQRDRQRLRRRPAPAGHAHPARDLAARHDRGAPVTADWLMCQDECVPGSAKLTLSLPVSAEPPHARPGLGRQGSARSWPSCPSADPAWTCLRHPRRQGAVTLTAAERARGQAPRARAGPSFLLGGRHDRLRPAPGGRRATARAASRSRSPSPRTARRTRRAQGRPHLQAGLAPRRVAARACRWTRPSAPPAGRGRGSWPPRRPAAGGFLGTLALAFVGGLILNLMPCVFPVLGIKILGFVNQAGRTAAR
jgi:hypothetical protein